MEITELLYDFLVAPREGIEKLRSIHREKDWLIALLIVAVAIFSQTLANFIIKPPASNSLLFFLTFGLLGALILVVIAWMFMTALFHFVASWRESKAAARELFILLGWSFLPLTLLPAAAILSKAFGGAGYTIYIIFYLFVLGWLIRLQVLSIRELYTISGEKALLIYITPAIILSVLMVILFTVSIVLVVFLIASSI
jgi:hypothetical protein